MTANYKPLRADDVEMIARRSTVLRTVLLLVILSFVLFCLLGYYYQPAGGNRDYARNQYLLEGASHEALLRRLKKHSTIQEDVSVPVDKAHLLENLQSGNAIKFHEKICSNCHTVPGYVEWLGVVKDDYTMDIHVTARREGAYASWEPIYVGTKHEPEYDERLSWEGKADKMTQGFIMCILGYDFHVLDNGFLVHRPGIKTIAQANRPPQQAKQRAFMRKTIAREISTLYAILSFILFYLLGYYYLPSGGNRNYARNQYLVEGASQEALLRRLKTILNCNTPSNEFQLETHGNNYLLRNFYAPKRLVHCYETITYTTHADYTFLDNVVPLLERWLAPVSIALYAPAVDLDRSVALIQYLLECHEQRALVRDFVSFHLYFEFEHLPTRPVSYYRELLSVPLVDCTNATNAWNLLLRNDNSSIPTFRAANNLTYPVNVGRNIARSAAGTHFVLASDIELYPNPNFIPMFLRMIAHPFYQYTLHSPSVYVLPVFEVAEDVSVPVDKAHLLENLQSGNAIKFHEKICSNCHTVPGYVEWLGVVKDDYTMDIHVTARREGAYASWEP
uniref:N-acetyllactosaminide beta-1,3-N-acetylglucosaminyltransferase n=1 Tax=Anopheles melas TaxID=34690 RepID=A0A182TXC7_9DIPT